MNLSKLREAMEDRGILAWYSPWYSPWYSQGGCEESDTTEILNTNGIY